MGSCGGCSETWTALGTAHCAAKGCHRTFASVGLFDAHRSQHGERGSCVDPVRVKGLEYRDGMWRGPEMDQATKLAKFGRR